MTGLSESPHFQALWVSALQFYEEKTGISLEKHPLAVQLQNCPSVESINAVLERQTRAFSHYRKHSKIMKAFEAIVSVLTPLSAAASLVSAVGMVCQKGPMACFASLTVFHRTYSHPHKQYRQLSVSYLKYVPFPS